MPTSSSPPHVILGVSAAASREDIQIAWRRAAARLHPDRNPDPSASARLAEVNAARAAMLARFDEQNRVDDLSSVFEGLFGDLFRNAAGARAAQSSTALPTVRVRVPLDRWLWGGDGSVTGTDGTVWNFKLPAGASSPARHRVETNSGEAMDLLLECEDQAGYVRRGNRYVITQINLDVVDAILGGPILLAPLGFHEVKVEVPAGSHAGTVLRVELPGSVIVDVQVSLVVPTKLTPARRAALEAYRANGPVKAVPPKPPARRRASKKR